MSSRSFDSVFFAFVKLCWLLFRLRFSHLKCDFELWFSIYDAISSHFAMLLGKTQREIPKLWFDAPIYFYFHLWICSSATKKYCWKYVFYFKTDPSIHIPNPAKWMEKCQKFTSQMVSLKSRIIFIFQSVFEICVECERNNAKCRWLMSIYRSF